MGKSRIYSFLLMLLVLAMQSAVFAGTARVTLVPSAEKVQPGDEFTVRVKVATDTSLVSIFAVAIWDSKQVELLSCRQTEGFEEEGAYYPSFQSAFEPNKAYVGVAEANGEPCLAVNYESAVAVLKFKVAEETSLSSTITIALSSNPADAAIPDCVAGTICAWDADLNKVDMEVQGATVAVVKMFNVSDGEMEVSECPTGVPVFTEANTFSFTDENGDAYAARGGIESIDNDNINLTLGGVDIDYDPASFGAFSVSEGRIVWDANVDTTVIDHQVMVFTVPFTAKANDADYTSSNDYVLTVDMANNPPLVGEFIPGPLAENSKVTFTFSMMDPDGDVVMPVKDSVTFNGESIAGSFTAVDGTWVFISDNEISQDYIAHTATDKNSAGVPVRPWNFTFKITDEIDIVDVQRASGDNKDTWIADVDRAQGTPSITKYEPASPTTESDITVKYETVTDLDGDIVTYSVQWSNGERTYDGEKLPAAETAKGETWTATVTATTKPYGEDVVTSVTGDKLVIENTKPVIKADTYSIFIPKWATTSAKVQFTITDADSTDVFTVNAIAVKGTAVATEVIDGKFTVTYTVDDEETEFNDGRLTVKVNDGDDDSNEVAIDVAFKGNPSAEITVVGDADATLGEVDADGNPSQVAFKIMASDNAGVAPYGIKSIRWSVTDGDGILISSDSEKNNSADADGNYPEDDEMEVSIVTKGYDTLSGKDRGAKATYTVKVEVVDAIDTVTTQLFPVTVNDIDRAPNALEDVEYAYLDSNITGAKLQVKAQETADMDGDEVSYVYALYIDGESIETSAPVAGDAPFTFTTSLVKGQKPSLKAHAVSKPAYEGAVELQSEDYTIDDLPEIENSAPVLTAPENGVAEVAIEEFVSGYNEATAILTFGYDSGNEQEFDVKFAYEDIDEAADADKVTVTLNDDGMAGYATVAIADGKLLITREPNVNTVGLEDDARPFFTMTATDDADKSVTAKFFVTITPVNEKPVVAAAEPIVVNADTVPEKLTFAVTFGTSADEAQQVIADVQLVKLDDDAGVLADYSLDSSEDSKKVVLTYALNEDIASLVGKEARLVFKVQDNGATPFEDTSDEVVVKFIVEQATYSITHNGNSFLEHVVPGQKEILCAYGVRDGKKFSKWEVEGFAIDDDGLPIIALTMPNHNVVINELTEELGYEVPEGWSTPKATEEAMVFFASVTLPNGYVVDHDDTLVGLFDDEGNCYGVGAPNASMSGKFGYSVFYLTAFKNGEQTTGLTLKFWNRLTNEIIPLNETIDFKDINDGLDEEADIFEQFFTKIGFYEPFRWTTAYKLNDARNPESPYFNPEIYGEDIEGTLFSMRLEATWDNSMLSYDFKLRLHNSATTMFDEDYDTMQPERTLPVDYDEYAFLISSDDIPLQLDSRPAIRRSAQWTMKVVVPENKPATILWDSKNIPAVWNATIKLMNEDGEVKDSRNLSDDESSIVIEEPGEWYLLFDFFNYDGLAQTTINLKPGWNLITPTLNLLDDSIDELLDFGVFTLADDNTTYLNATREDIVPGKGLWIFTHESHDLDVLGTPVDEWELSFGNDLSLIGVLEDIDAQQLPDNLIIWEWTRLGYRLLNGGLKAGKAYWMQMAE